jgi:PAS domain-containing protein
VLVAGLDQPSQEQLKLLLTHGNQLGAALDRLGSRREAEESRLRSIADVVVEGIALVDADGAIEAENSAAVNLLEALRTEGEDHPGLRGLIEEARRVTMPVEREITLAAAPSLPLPGRSPGRTTVWRSRFVTSPTSESRKIVSLSQSVWQLWDSWSPA